ncbi:HAD family hydrolase [Gemmiger formicilis]|uniref:HAD family hydrolase n=1 Tax=Gemmiger formicilis TaxID=745368 RepID=UPI0019599482|nr:HAD family hydrolase [Gemmiger formicilis]
MQQLEQKLIKVAGSYRAVAFDVFDTLLFRDVAAPSDLFVLMEKTGRVPAGFAEKRLEAEKLARTPGREVTLPEIYAQEPLSGLDPQPEIDAEQKVVMPNRALLSAAQKLHAQGKAIYAVSDMYLSQPQVEAMLRRCGFDFLDGVFVSSSYGVQKRSGKLFRVFLQETGLEASQVLFVGNDRRVDIVGAALAGIRGYLIPEPKPLLYFARPETPVQGALQAFIRNRHPEGNPWQSLGYSAIGPLLTSFAIWLRETYGGDRLMFLARDMYLVRRIYRELYGCEAEYLRVSRRSLCPALLQRPMNEGGLALLADALPRQELTVGQILVYCGFDTSASLHGADLNQRIDLRSRPLSAETKEHLLELAALGKATAGAGVRHQADLVRRYLRQNQLKEKPPVLVDIGSGGTTQRILESLCGAEMQGAYLACDERLNQSLPQTRARAFLFDGNPAPLWYWVGQPLLERLISEPCGATVGYERPANTVIPSLEDALPQQGILELQQAALEFAHDWKNGSWGTLAPGPDMPLQAYLSLVRTPQLRDIQLLGDLTVEDGGTWSLAAPQPWGIYIKNPRAFVRDFGKSRWKNAFLKRAFRIPLPYAWLYEMLKRKREGGL